jgi:hypothetical protein
MPEFNWPNDTQHLLEIGRTGSGKTLAGLWHLSGRNWDRKPWVIFDTKGDENIEKIGRMDGAKHIRITEQPGKNGLYIVRPRPDQQDEINEFLWKIHARNNVGLYVDEGYMIGDIPSYNAILTQGRSKHIPIITLTQRPSWLTRFAFSEASFYQVFALNDREDRKRVQQFIPKDLVDVEVRLPPYHSLWYDTKDNRVTKFLPTPPADAIIGNFRQRLMPRRIAI